ncbi:MAG: AraC family transcriptional regulator [Anaerolineae bacterium]|nr:AraC family transcriptional regulator [Anaerolineae bacterium]
MALFYKPSPPINQYIYGFYYLDGLMPYPREKIMPDAWLDLKINLGDAVHAYKADQSEPIAICSDSWWVGLWDTYHIVDWPQDIQCFGISFKPGGAYPFLGIPLAELQNHVGSLDAIWGNFAAEIRERLYDAPTIQARFALLEQILLSRLCEASHGLHSVQYALAQIARHHGTLSIKALSDEMGISQNHLGTQFKRLVGGTPKDLARLYRFKHVLKNIDLAQPVDWTQVAHQSLYYDQSHFNKDFMAFTGHTPGDYLRLRRQVHDQNPQHALYLRALPTD